MASMDSPPMTHHVMALREGHTEIKVAVARVDERVRALELPPPPPPPTFVKPVATAAVAEPPPVAPDASMGVVPTVVPVPAADPFPSSAEYRWGIRIGGYAFIIPWIRLILRREPLAPREETTAANG